LALVTAVVRMAGARFVTWKTREPVSAFAVLTVPGARCGCRV